MKDKHFRRVNCVVFMRKAFRRLLLIKQFILHMSVDRE